MSNYVLVMLWLGVCAALARKSLVTRNELVHGKEKRISKPGFAVLVFLPFIIWAGFRTGRGHADTNAYITLYRMIPTQVRELRRYLSLVEKDVGFHVFAAVIKSVFGRNYRPFLLIIAIIQGASIIKFYRKYSSHYIFSIYLFVAAGEYMAWMLNGIRQFLAIAIIYFAIPALFEKKYIRFILVVLLAATFHRTALIMIPVVLLAQGKPWNSKTLLCIGGAVSAVFFTSQFTDFLESTLEDTIYSGNLTEMAGQAGTNPLRVAIYCVPMILAFVGRRRLKKMDDPVINVAINMSIMTAALSLVGMVTSGIMIGRLPIYTGMFNYILLPYEIDHMFDKRSARAVRIVAGVLYLGFYYYLMHYAYGKI